MKRLSFLVNRGENDCFMVHGLEWATYVEGVDWMEIFQALHKHIFQEFAAEERPSYLDFCFPDGRIISMSA
ncbi:MAG: hypothetical protein FWG74_00875 [Planctomycetes bacterium]|nr:hypothetical protein [Planctomycetota bacterium]